MDNNPKVNDRKKKKVTYKINSDSVDDTEQNSGDSDLAALHDNKENVEDFICGRYGTECETEN